MKVNVDILVNKQKMLILTTGLQLGNKLRFHLEIESAKKSTDSSAQIS